MQVGQLRVRERRSSRASAARRASPEQCDCLDNDCDGTVDNTNAPGLPPLCGVDKECVTAGGVCQCAAKCDGEFPCPPGQKCETVTLSSTGETLMGYCVIDPDAACGDCGTKTVKDANGDGRSARPRARCWPAAVAPGLRLQGSESAVDEPCLGVTCQNGKVCTEYGPKAGTCVADNCWNVPCQGCDQACNMGACVDDPVRRRTPARRARSASRAATSRSISVCLRART